MTTETYDKDLYLKNWAEKILKCPNTPFDIAAQLLNTTRNFQTAVAVLFNLSFRTHKDYILACADYWKVNFPPGSTATYDYCLQFQQHYVNEVCQYPSDA